MNLPRARPCSYGSHLLVWLWLLSAPSGLSAAAAPAAAGEVISFRLDNGFAAVVAVRPGMELAAVNLTVGVGAADDPQGSSGLAHLLEHVSLSGTARQGSRDPQAEARALKRLDAAHADLERQRSAAGLDLAALGDLQRRVEAAAAEARRWAEPGDVYGTRLESRGAIGLNATTGSDTTQFFSRLPVGQIPYWIELEADRLRNPMLRGFYTERQVVIEEIATLTGGRPAAQELFLEQVFPGLPSSRSVFGRPSEIRDIGRRQAQDRLAALYRPERMVLSIVGDVRPREIRRLCQRAFGDWPPPPAASAEPRARGPLVERLAGARVGTFNGLEAPIVLLGFPRPPPEHPAAAALAALAELVNAEHLAPRGPLLGDERRLAWSVGATAGHPRSRHPSLFLLHLYGYPGVRHELLIRHAGVLLARLPSLAEGDLIGGIRLAEARLARALADPETLASLLASHQAVDGDWRVPFRRLEALRALEPAAVREVARRLLQLDEAVIAEAIAIGTAAPRGGR